MNASVKMKDGEVTATLFGSFLTVSKALRDYLELNGLNYLTTRKQFKRFDDGRLMVVLRHQRTN